jgi:hypothetical protein
MSPVKIAAKRAAHYNLIVVAIVAVFALWAIAKAQSVDMHRFTPEHAATSETRH